MQVDERLDKEERLQKLGRRPGALMEDEYDEDEEMLHNLESGIRCSTLSVEIKVLAEPIAPCSC